MPASISLPEASPKHSSRDCRVWQRHGCGLETECQPIAARGDNDMSWSAQIHDLSVAGIGLLLKRRFERGAGLAVEIPETATAPADTLLAKVVHTTAWPDGRWLLGCVFVSQLSEDELQRLVDMGQGRQETTADTVREHEPPPPPPQPSEEILIGDVTWQGAAVGPEVQRRIRRLHVKAKWPLAPGTVLKIWFGKKPENRARVRVERCFQRDGRWFVDYSFLDSPDGAILRSFGHVKRSGGD